MSDVVTIETDAAAFGVLDDGPRDGPVAMLLHGWPDDACSWAAVVARMNAEGWRTVTPWLRGIGPTALAPGAMRSGDLAGDALALADALGPERVAIVGHDWGARAAYICACAAPERLPACVAMSVGWGTNDPGQALSLGQVQGCRYHWHMALDRGERLVRDDRRAFTRHIWDVRSVAGPIADERFEEPARSFDNPDCADVVPHSHRVRWGLAEPDSACAEIAAQVAADPTIAVPTLTIHGGADPVDDPATSEGREALFSGPHERRVLDRVGHFPRWEAPERTAGLVLDFLGAHR